MVFCDWIRLEIFKDKSSLWKTVSTFNRGLGVGVNRPAAHVLRRAHVWSGLLHGTKYCWGSLFSLVINLNWGGSGPALKTNCFQPSVDCLKSLNNVSNWGTFIFFIIRINNDLELNKNSIGAIPLPCRLVLVQIIYIVLGDGAKHSQQVLQGLASRGKTVICTIHQPSSEVFALFDRILLMAEGRTAFLGPLDQALDFFASQVTTLNISSIEFFLEEFVFADRQILRLLSWELNQFDKDSFNFSWIF